MRVLLTGGRRRQDYRLIWDTLSVLLDKYGPFVLVHGACSVGADYWAHLWALAHPDCTEVQYPAQWRNERGEIDRSAGFRRNAEMVSKGADLVLAFPHPAGSGTQHTMKLAREAGIKVLEIAEAEDPVPSKG